MKNVKWLVIGAAVLLVLLVGALIMNNKDDDKKAAVSTSRTARVLITNTGFDPAAMTIKTGTTVTWRNTDQAAHRIASNPHPDHTDLKGLYSGVLNEKDTYSFTYDKAGKYTYHDELNPVTNATIVVKD